MDNKERIELAMIIIMGIAIIGTFVRSLITKKGIGARAIQFSCVTLLIPTIIILALEEIIKGETVATLIGGLAGYVLSGISNYDSENRKPRATKNTTTNTEFHK